MQILRVNDHLKNDVEEGIWCEFEDHTWLFYIKDKVWVEEERSIFRKKGVKISFVQKGIVDVFLVTINDLLETSDIPYCLLDAGRDFQNSLKDSQSFHIVLYLVDADNTICGVKEGAIPQAISTELKKAFRSQIDMQYDERSYAASLTKLQKKYEPFELETFALYSWQI